VICPETVITCFPSCWGPEDKKTTGIDLLDKIRKHIHDTRPEISSVYHLATIITSLCVGYVEQCKGTLPGCQDTLLHMFSSSIGIVVSTSYSRKSRLEVTRLTFEQADEEVKCFETFKTDLARSGRSTNDDKTAKLDIQKEITLLEEVKDIRDELNILKSIFEDQRALLGKLFSLVAGPHSAGENTTENDPILNYYQERSEDQKDGYGCCHDL
jgi:hypothetical protein